MAYIGYKNFIIFKLKLLSKMIYLHLYKVIDETLILL